MNYTKVKRFRKLTDKERPSKKGVYIYCPHCNGKVKVYQFEWDFFHCPICHCGEDKKFDVRTEKYYWSIEIDQNKEDRKLRKIARDFGKKCLH